MTTHTDHVTRAETHLAAAAGTGDPRVEAVAALAEAILARRGTIYHRVDADAIITALAGDTSPLGDAGRAVAAAVQADKTELDNIAVDDGGFPSPLIAA